MSTRLRGLVPRGVIAGVIGATALAFWFLVIDGSQGEPFRTPGFLGAALLGTDALEPGAGPVILYTLLPERRQITTPPSSASPWAYRGPSPRSTRHPTCFWGWPSASGSTIWFFTQASP